jgi:hypothetical protein
MLVLADKSDKLCEKHIDKAKAKSYKNFIVHQKRQSKETMAAN